MVTAMTTATALNRSDTACTSVGRMTEDYLRPAEAGAVARVSRETVFRWIREGRLPCIRTGVRATTLIRRSDLDAFLEQNRVGGTP